jgi:hypothetical protein
VTGPSFGRARDCARFAVWVRAGADLVIRIAPRAFDRRRLKRKAPRLYAITYWSKGDTLILLNEPLCFQRGCHRRATQFRLDVLGAAVSGRCAGIGRQSLRRDQARPRRAVRSGGGEVDSEAPSAQNCTVAYCTRGGVVGLGRSTPPKAALEAHGPSAADSDPKRTFGDGESDKHARLFGTFVHTAVNGTKQ